MLEADPDAGVTVDLSELGLLLPDGSTVDFVVDPFARQMMLAGTDEIGWVIAAVRRHRCLGVEPIGRGWTPDPSRPRPAEGDEMPADPNVVRKLYEARQGTNLEAAADLIAPDVIWHEPYEYLGTLNGREAVMDAIRQSMVETEGTFKLVLTDLLASDEHVVALVDFSAERHGGWMSGREIGVFKVADGMITEVWFYTAEDPDAVSEFMRG